MRYAPFKRAAGVALTLAAAPLWLPAMAAIAVVSRLVQGRGVIFRQERAGLGGKPFVLLKFRTMRDGTGDDQARTTRFGRWLRATSLDELPQLLQVLSGKMALVGPRPLPVRYLSRYTPEENRRHLVRPGITGYAQVNGRNAISWERKLELDIWYVDHLSLRVDLSVLCKTVAAVLLRRGVNAGAGVTMEEFRPEQAAMGR